MKITIISKDIGRMGKRVILCASSVLILSSFTGCDGINDIKELFSDDKIVVNTNGDLVDGSGDIQDVIETTATEISTTELTTEESTEVNDEVNDNVEYTYTQQMWDEFEEEAWLSIEGKINNVNRESFNAALKVFNIDYLVENNPQILIDYYGKGIDVENELNQAYIVLSQVREYNTTRTSDDDYYSFNKLLLNSVDKSILSVLDGYVKEIMFLSLDTNNQANVARIEEIFDEVNKFSKGEGMLAVVVGGELVEVPQIKLSKGGVIVSENIMQDISVLCQNIISEERRKELDDSLRSKDVLAKIQETMATYNGMASVLNPQVSEEETNEIVNTIKANREAVYQELSLITDVTEEEVYALYTIANIDFLVNSTNSKNAFELLYPEGFDINKTFEDAERAVEKIELYNMSVENIDDIYTYGHFFLESETNIVSTKAVAQMAYNLSSADGEVVALNFNRLKGYTQYSSEVTINYTKDGEIIKLDKNALNKGGNQIIDWISYYAFLNNKSKINNNEAVDSMISLVDGTTVGFNPYADIVLMVEEYCQANNVVVYDYTVGDKQKVLEKDAQ